ncbi:MAG TPA: hypothetical protein VN281_13365 [Verrucomicrobiae bacterium]|nr:hypothetical protein [Verrucomicrobiae bacterium]
MATYRKVDRTKYYFGAIVIAWCSISFMLTLALARADDNPDMKATTPWMLKVTCAVAFFPMRYLQGWDEPSNGGGDRSGLSLLFWGTLLNAFFWAALIVGLYRLVAHLYRHHWDGRHEPD